MIAKGDCLGPLIQCVQGQNWLCPNPGEWRAQAPCLRSSTCVENISSLQNSLLIICLYLIKMGAFLWRDCKEFLRKVRRLNSHNFLYQNKSFSGDDTELIVWRILINNSFFPSVSCCICVCYRISWRCVVFWYVFSKICSLSFWWATSWTWPSYTTFIKLL